MMENLADVLMRTVIQKKNPSVIGLDPDLAKMPACYKVSRSSDCPLQDVAEAIIQYNKDIIDAIHELIPAVKPQIAFYEKYGSHGIRAFEETVAYAKEKGLVVIEDGKRNDIGNTARAYADGHLGLVEGLGGEMIPAFDVDFLTVSTYLGSESLAPFVEVCKASNKGIFILVKTSNSGSGEIQNVKAENGKSVSENVARYVATHSEAFVGSRGYSPIGAVVGATYPEEAAVLRRIMPKSIFLVPGYGSQGAGAKDVMPCFNSDGLGAVINSARNILYGHLTEETRLTISKADYLQQVIRATADMQQDIYQTLKVTYPEMVY